MNSKKMTLMIAVLVFCLGLAAYTTPALASPYLDEVPYQPGTGGIQARVQRAGASNITKSVVLYDQDWNIVAEKSLFGEEVSFSSLPVGRYYLAAYMDDVVEMQFEDVTVLANQMAQVTLQLLKPTSPVALAQMRFFPSAPTCGGGSVSQEPSMTKVFPPWYNSTVIYLQCGKIVEKIAPDCGCPTANWNYINSCQKGNKVYITLPCLHGSRP